MFLWLLTQPRLDRIALDFVWRDQDRAISVRMYVNRALDGRWVMVCRKGMSGDVFKCWVDDRRVVLKLSRPDAVFLGGREERFSILPNTPKLTADQWFQLVVRGRLDGRSDASLDRVEDWLVWTPNDGGVSLRWRLRKRSVVLAKNDDIFEPRVTDRTERYQLSQLELAWDESE